MAEDSLSINTQSVGESDEIVVFLPGLFGQGKNFTQIAKGLQPDFQSVLVDLPNHGGSDWTEDFDYVSQADLVADHLRGTVAGDGPINLVGHSWAGRSRWCWPCATLNWSADSWWSTSRRLNVNPWKSSSICSTAWRVGPL